MTARPLPVPEIPVEVVFLLLGSQFGRSFGKQLDEAIKYSPWFEALKLSSLLQDQITVFLLPRLLDFLHHGWIGALIMIQYPAPSWLFWFSFDLMLDDCKDIPRQIQEFFNLSSVYTEEEER